MGYPLIKIHTAHIVIFLYLRALCKPMVLESVWNILHTTQKETLIFTALAVFAGSAIAGHIVDWIVRDVLKKAAAKTQTKWDDILLEIIDAPIILIAYAAGAWLGLYTLGLTPENLGPLYPFYKATILVIATYALVTASNKFFALYEREVMKKTSSTIDDIVIPLASKLIPTILVFSSLMLLLKIFGVDVTPFLAGAGIVGLALGLAAQAPLSNFFSGLLLLADKPFEKGDRVEFGKDYIGDVEEIGSFSTKIRTFENNVVIIPNSKITQTELVNHHKEDQRIRVFLDVNVAYGTASEKVKKVLMDIAGSVDEVLKEPLPEVYFFSYGDFSLNFKLVVWVQDTKQKFIVKDKLNTGIQEAFAREKIHIPFPARDIYLHEKK